MFHKPGLITKVWVNLKTRRSSFYYNKPTHAHVYKCTHTCVYKNISEHHFLFLEFGRKHKLSNDTNDQHLVVRQ